MLQKIVGKMTPVTWGFLKIELKDVPDDTAVVMLDADKIQVLNIVGFQMGKAILGKPGDTMATLSHDPKDANTDVCYLVAKVMEHTVIERQDGGEG